METGQVLGGARIVTSDGRPATPVFRHRERTASPSDGVLAVMGCLIAGFAVEPVPEPAVA